MNDTERASRWPIASGKSCSNATRRSPRRSATSATTTGSRTSARRAGRCRRPGTARRWRSSPIDRAARSTSHDDGRARGDRDAALAGIELGRTGYMANHFVGPASCWATSRRSSARTPEHLDRYGARCARPFRSGARSRARASRRGSRVPRTVVERAVAQVERIVAAPEKDAAARRWPTTTRRPRCHPRRLARRRRAGVRRLPRRAARLPAARGRDAR